jgi:hypothetical protein
MGRVSSVFLSTLQSTDRKGFFQKDKIRQFCRSLASAQSVDRSYLSARALLKFLKNRFYFGNPGDSWM